MLFKLSGSSDPIMTQLKADDNPDIRRLAELTESAIKAVEAQKQREAELSGPAGSMRIPSRAGSERSGTTPPPTSPRQ
jgi:hypothetical protein